MTVAAGGGLCTRSGASSAGTPVAKIIPDPCSGSWCSRWPEHADTDQRLLPFVLQVNGGCAYSVSGGLAFRGG